MRKNFPVFVMCVWLSCALGGLTVFAQSPSQKYLTAEDVEKATGLKGVKLIPRGSVAGANGDLNFADASGELILMAQFSPAKNYDSYRSKYANGTVSGVGTEAVKGALMPGMPENLVAFTKGTHCVVLTSFGDFIKKKLYVTADQLSELGKVVASRL
jgi:hypothetical protein